MPSLKVGYLGSANGVQDSQDNKTSGPWNKRAVKAGATLLDCRKVKSRCVSDRLYANGVEGGDGRC